MCHLGILFLLRWESTLKWQKIFRWTLKWKGESLFSPCECRVSRETWENERKKTKLKININLSIDLTLIPNMLKNWISLVFSFVSFYLNWKVPKSFRFESREFHNFYEFWWKIQLFFISFFEDWFWSENEWIENTKINFTFNILFISKEIWSWKIFSFLILVIAAKNSLIFLLIEFVENECRAEFTKKKIKLE